MKGPTRKRTSKVLSDALSEGDASDEDPQKQALLTNKYQELSKVPLLIGFDGRELTGIRLLNNLGQTTIINFNDVSMNPKLSKSLFKLSWPSNTDVVDMT